MAIRLHENTFRELAAWQPARLRDSGGITVTTLQLLCDYAARQLGLDVGSPCMIMWDGPPSGHLYFGPLQRNEHWWAVEVRLCALDSFWITQSVERPSGNLTWDYSGPPRGAEQLAREHLEISTMVGIEMGCHPLVFPVRPPESVA